MQAEIITIGDEILIGQIVDTNSAFISKTLNKVGISVYQITSVQDDRNHILKALKEAEENADIIIITGGLGPTKDDITKKTIAEYFEDTLVQDEEVLKNIKRIWDSYIKQPLLQVNIDQALIPSKSTALMNLNGSAPGMWIEKNGKVFVSLPGVPYEMKALLEHEVIPRLRKAFKFPYIIHKTILTHGIGESSLADRISNWEDNLPSHIKLAYLPNLGRVRLRLSAKGKDKNELESALKNQIDQLMIQIEDVFVGFEDDGNIEMLIGQALVANHHSLATAESCTGGKIAEIFTANPGASQYFKGSIVSYATEVKMNLLGIPKELINTHSVVSREVTEAMAARVKELLNTDYVIATTGNAGPTKGDSEAELGTVFIAIASNNGIISEEFHFGNHRERVINRTANKALEMLHKEILKK